MADDNEEGWIHWGARMAFDGVLVIGAVLAAPVVLDLLGQGATAIASSITTTPTLSTIAGDTVATGSLTTMQSVGNFAGSALSGIGTGLHTAGSAAADGVSWAVAQSAHLAGVSDKVLPAAKITSEAFLTGTGQGAVFSAAGNGIVEGAKALGTNISKNPIPYAAGAGGLIVGGMVLGNRGPSTPSPEQASRNFADAVQARRAADARARATALQAGHAMG